MRRRHCISHAYGFNARLHKSLWTAASVGRPVLATINAPPFDRDQALRSCAVAVRWIQAKERVRADVQASGLSIEARRVSPK
jgi:hypothetical protein